MHTLSLSHIFPLVVITIHSLTRSVCVFCELQAHLFIASNDDGNVDMISMWVCRQLEQRRSCAQSMDSPNSESS